MKSQIVKLILVLLMLFIISACDHIKVDDAELDLDTPYIPNIGTGLEPSKNQETSENDAAQALFLKAEELMNSNHHKKALLLVQPFTRILKGSDREKAYYLSGRCMVVQAAGLFCDD